MKSYDQTTTQMAMYLTLGKMLKETLLIGERNAQNWEDITFQFGLLNESLGHFQKYTETLEKRIEALENANS